MTCSPKAWAPLFLVLWFGCQDGVENPDDSGATGGASTGDASEVTGGAGAPGGSKASSGAYGGASTGDTGTRDAGTGGANTGGISARDAGTGEANAGGTGTGGDGGTGGTSSSCPRHSSGATFTNPLNASGSDPYMFYYDCNYYLTTSTRSSTLTIRKAPTIAGLKSVTPTVIWDGRKDTPSRCCNFWAPEIHQLNGPHGLRWYLYYTGGPGPNESQRNYVLESAGMDPMGPYTYVGHPHDSNDTWAIDSSVVTIDGSVYFLFSAWAGNKQTIYIAPMSDPWTLSGPRVRLSEPTYDWETKRANVNEGPIALQYDGKTFIAYSASACWGPDYAIGLLTLTGTNPLSTSSWSKSPVPVFQSANGAYGPAHNGFFKSPDGTEDWIVYHANSSTAGVCDGRQTTRIQRFTWNSDGTPNFGKPVATTTALTVPSGE